MRQLSVIPPMMYDSEQRRVRFINMNGLMEDPMKVYKARQLMNVWTEHEKEIFREKYVAVVAVIVFARKWLDGSFSLHCLNISGLKESRLMNVLDVQRTTLTLF